MMETYKTKDVASKTGIPGNLIRKYSQTLELSGYDIGKASGARCFKLDDIRLLKGIHERVAMHHVDINDAVVQTLKDLQNEALIHKSRGSVQEKEQTARDVTTTIQEQNKKFEEFMHKLDTLAQLNEAIIHQNSTLITQNRQKDEKLDDLMQQVYVSETQQEEILLDLVGHVQKSEAKQENKLNHLMSHMYKKDAKQEEKMNKVINQVYKKDASRDEQLMLLIREMQETKRMIAASQENNVVKSLRTLFSRLKPERTQS
ncbi:DUF3967 domain-containing protein [Ectobacillus sp. sgz5001026]|uniref:DUF3967 domain-containing protein n=1 Tax=Ectobacillus sp. sgz5001026 TaxID=3242473 RepID=UPI0036D2C8BE